MKEIKHVWMFHRRNSRGLAWPTSPTTWPRDPPIPTTTVVAAFFGFHFGAMEAEDSAAPFGFLLQLWLDKITTLLCWAAKRALTTVTEGR